MTRRLDTLCKDLNKKALVKLVKEVFPEAHREILNDWKNYDLEKIMGEVLSSANDYYMDGAYDAEQLIKVNDLLIKLRSA